MSRPTYIFKIPVAGDGAVGKTSLIVRYTQGTFTDTYKMTIGTSFAVKTVDLDRVMVKLQIWDLAGQPHFGGVRPLFYQGSTGVIYVFSVTDRASFDHLAGWLEEAGKNAGNVPGILIGNKVDLVDQRVVSREEAEAFAAQEGFLYIETSAKKDENVGDAFQQVAVSIIKTKWPEWDTEVEEPTPAAPVAPEPVAEPPASGTPEEPVAPIVTPSEPELIEPEVEQPSMPTPEPIPLPETVETPAEEPTPTVAPISEPLDVESVEPMEPPPISEPAMVAEPDSTPEPVSTTPSEPPTVSSPVEPEQPEDIVIAHKAESSLVEFVGVNLDELSKEEFEKRSVHAMQRLGVSDVGVLGTFLRSLIRQGQRDVVIESLESLQEER